MHLEEVVSRNRSTKKEKKRNSTSQKIKKEAYALGRAYLYSVGFSSLFYFSTLGALSRVDLLLVTALLMPSTYVPRKNMIIYMNNILYTQNCILILNKNL